MTLVGIDGGKGGWVGAISDETLSKVTFAVESSISALLAEATIATIDFPIGLPRQGRGRT